MPALDGNKKRKPESHLRTDVETAALPVGLGGEVRGEFCILVERYVLDHKHAFLAHGIYTQSAGDRRLRTARQKAKTRGEYKFTCLGDSE